MTLRLTKPVADFVMTLASPLALCAVPRSLPVDPEGAKAPLPSPAPYFVSQYVPGERIVLERNRLYKGARPQHVDRFVVELGVDIPTAFARVEDGSADYALGPPTYFVDNAARLARRHGVNKSQFFVVPVPGGVRMFALKREPSTLQGEHQAQASDELRRRSARVDARAGLVRGAPPTSTCPPRCRGT